MFADLYPIVEEYIGKKLFDHEVNLEDPRVLFHISEPELQDKLIKTFVDSLKDLAFTDREATIFDRIRLSDTQPFVWTKKVYQANKCIFNYVPCDNDLEVNFARFLDSVNDVKAFSKLVQKIGFFIEYRDSDGNLRYYYPDFIIRMEDKYVIAETKGEEDIDVKYKDNRAKLWCEDAKRLTGDNWIYVRVNEAEFYKYHFDSFEKMIQFFNSENNEDTRLK
jgi:type III restriction enzyme